jgi:hypothetical protein
MYGNGHSRPTQHTSGPHYAANVRLSHAEYSRIVTASNGWENHMSAGTAENTK